MLLSIRVGWRHSINLQYQQQRLAHSIQRPRPRAAGTWHSLNLAHTRNVRECATIESASSEQRYFALTEAAQVASANPP